MEDPSVSFAFIAVCSPKNAIKILKNKNLSKQYTLHKLIHALRVGSRDTIQAYFSKRVYSGYVLYVSCALIWDNFCLWYSWFSARVYEQSNSRRDNLLTYVNAICRCSGRSYERSMLLLTNCLKTLRKTLRCSEFIFERIEEFVE